MNQLSVGGDLHSVFERVSEVLTLETQNKIQGYVIRYMWMYAVTCVRRAVTGAHGHLNPGLLSQFSIGPNSCATPGPKPPVNR